MPTEDTKLIRFLQQECSRLKDENQLLKDDVFALRRYLQALQSLQETVQRFTPEQDILALLDDTLYCALELVDAADGSLMLIDEETDELVFVLVHGAVRKTLPGIRFDRRHGIAGWVAENARPVVVNNVLTDLRFLRDLDEQIGFETRALVAVPLVARGQVLGVIEGLNKRSGKEFTEEDGKLLSVLATLAASALGYAAATIEAEEQA